mmetsp:Transcript_6949/g.15224  ORF Transcript_6949/g.15224 Transcript_6949/m.15224 type:complete len:112 (+) Transcript_6949:117-452(+)
MAARKVTAERATAAMRSPGEAFATAPPASTLVDGSFCARAMQRRESLLSSPSTNHWPRPHRTSSCVTVEFDRAVDNKLMSRSMLSNLHWPHWLTARDQDGSTGQTLVLHGN